MHHQPGCPVLIQQKATRKTDKVRPDELDVTVLTDQGLKDELLKHGVDAGPIVGECSHQCKQKDHMRSKVEVTSTLGTQMYYMSALQTQGCDVLVQHSQHFRPMCKFHHLTAYCVGATSDYS